MLRRLSTRRRNPHELLAHTVTGRKAIQAAVTTQMEAMVDKTRFRDVTTYRDTIVSLWRAAGGQEAVIVTFGTKGVSVTPETMNVMRRSVMYAGQTVPAVVSAVMVLVQRFGRERAYWTNHLPHDLGEWAPSKPLPNPARKAAKRRNPADPLADPLAYGRGPIPPRVAQAAVEIIGWDAAERIVGPGLLGGASGYDLNRLVWAAKVERERQGGRPAVTRRKRNPARRALTWHPVGGEHVATHGDATYTLARTTRAFSFTGREKIPVWTVTVQTSDRQPYEVTAAWPLSEAKARANTHAGTTFNKWKPARG